MKRSSRRQQGKAATELIEEAVHALRTAPAATLVAYYFGSLPFVLGLLFFWADMSRSPFARQHVVEAALGVSLLFLWMKFWQVIFARHLRAHVCGEPPEKLRLPACRRILFTQATLQPTGFFLLPLAAIPALPLVWVYAFYQTLTALGDEGSGGLREVFGRCCRHATRWPAQNHYVLAYMAGFGFFVFVNCSIACVALPALIKTLFGIETVFSRGGTAMLNTTFFATMLAITYLCVDPILKAIYVLRCFYGDSVKSGADLKASLKQFNTEAPRIAGWILIVSLLVIGNVARAAETAPAPPPQTSASTVSPEQLNRAIEEVIQERKYTWRMPREKIVEDKSAKKGMLAEFFERVGRMLRRWAEGFFRWLGNLLGKIFGNIPRFSPSDGSGESWIVFMRVLLCVLAAGVFAAAGILLFRVWKTRQRRAGVVTPEALASVPDITDENVGADQLPEDGWTKLGRELLARGEFRLAMRAFYLASLAHLAERNLIGLARFKSNRDYARELQRRAHAFPGLLSVFDENVSVFDRVWYGTHQAGMDLVTQFAANVERIKTGA